MILNIAVSIVRAAVGSNGAVRVLLPDLNGELVTCGESVPDAAEVIILVRKAGRQPGWFEVQTQINANGDQVPAFTRPVRIVEQIDDPLLAEDEATKEILSRLSKGHDLLDEQRELVQEGKLTIKDPRNIETLITLGMEKDARGSDDFRLIGKHCESLVTSENWTRLRDFVNSTDPGLHCFADGLKENKMLGQFIKN